MSSHNQSEQGRKRRHEGEELANSPEPLVPQVSTGRAQTQLPLGSSTDNIYCLYPQLHGPPNGYSYLTNDAGKVYAANNHASIATQQHQGPAFFPYPTNDMGHLQGRGGYHTQDRPIQRPVANKFYTMDPDQAPLKAFEGPMWDEIISEVEANDVRLMIVLLSPSRKVTNTRCRLVDRS